MRALCFSWVSVSIPVCVCAETRTLRGECVLRHGARLCTAPFVQNAKDSSFICNIQEANISSSSTTVLLCPAIVLQYTYDDLLSTASPFRREPAFVFSMLLFYIYIFDCGSSSIIHTARIDYVCRKEVSLIGLLSITP